MGSGGSGEVTAASYHHTPDVLQGLPLGQARLRELVSPRSAG
jgi:hypothetical protein